MVDPYEEIGCGIGVQFVLIEDIYLMSEGIPRLQTWTRVYISNLKLDSTMFLVKFLVGRYALSKIYYFSWAGAYYTYIFSIILNISN